jgi:hypothetical protein
MYECYVCTKTNKTGGKPTSQYVQILGKSQSDVDTIGDRTEAADGTKSDYKPQTFLGRRSNINQKFESMFS